MSASTIAISSGRGQRRRAPINPGVATARVLGATEEAIRTVLARDAAVTDRGDVDWAVAILEETRRRPPKSTQRLR